jgi:membrane-associated protein
MEWIYSFVEIFLHLDKHLAVLITEYGVWIYAILFFVIFAETGFVVTPFLPGDSLLFIAGSLAATGGMNIHLLVGLLFTAAVMGNTLNYEIGRWLGPRVFANKASRWLNPHYIERTHEFFERWGAMSVVIARFVPFLRTYVPFVAGIGAMTRAKYMLFTIIGAALWVGLLTYLGYFFGNIPWVKSNQGFVAIAVIVISLLPILFGLIRAKLAQPSKVAKLR